jgi:hypothetical protein
MAQGIKTGGRKEGTPNKDRKELIEMLRDKYPDYHPVIALAEIAHTSKSEVLRYKAHREVAKYICPQLRSIEVKETTPPEKQQLFIIHDGKEISLKIKEEIENKELG